MNIDFWIVSDHRHLGPGFFFLNYINKMCIYNVYEPVWHVPLWRMPNGFIYVVDAHFIDKIEENKYPEPKCLCVR